MSKLSDDGLEVELDGVRKTYAETVAVDELSLEVRRGELLSLLGPSGCGKTTTLRMVAGFVAPTAGSIRIRGQDVTNRPPHRRDTAMVFQSYALFPHMTVFDNVAFGLRRRRTPGGEVRGRVQQALELVALEGFERRYPRQLSGGQQQRVALARALVVNPAVLLLDEPLSNLDAKLRASTRVELRRVQQELGLTAIFVTHDQEEAMAISDRIAVMNRGQLEQVGTAHEIYERPSSLFVAGFVGSSNVFEGTLNGRDGDDLVLDTGVGLLRGRAAGSGAPALGAAARLLVRAERLQVRAMDRTAEPAANAIAGTVEVVSYLGAITQVAVRLGNGTRLVAAGSAPGLASLQTQTSVVVSWPADQALVFAA